MRGLSIIIPTLNEEKYIGKLLSCLVNQTYKTFEVIVVDGHSDDKVKSIVTESKEKFDLNLIEIKVQKLLAKKILKLAFAKVYNTLTFQKGYELEYGLKPDWYDY